MKQIIDFRTKDLCLKFWRAVGEEAEDAAQAELERAERALEATWKSLYDNLVSGLYGSIGYRAGDNVYILHKSAKKAGYIQRSCFWDKGGEYIALSDRQYLRFEDFRRDGLPDGKIVYAEGRN